MRKAASQADSLPEAKLVADADVGNSSVAEAIFTPIPTIEVKASHNPTCHIIWDRLDT